MLVGGCRGGPGADYRQPSSTDEGTCRDECRRQEEVIWYGGIFSLRGDEGVLDRGPRHLPVLKAHPFRRRLGEVWLGCIDTTVPLLDVLEGHIRSTQINFQSTHSLCAFFGGISCGGMLGLLATWRCLLLDIIQTGVTSWLVSQSAVCGPPLSHYLFGKDP